ncbi:MAG: hypothetical protein Q9213_000165 [Squamulea squamosa]
MSVDIDSTIKKQESTSVEPEEASPRGIHGIKWLLTVVAILSSTLLFSLDNTIVAVVQPSVVNGFGSVNKLPWLGAAFALGSISILPWSKAYGVFNVKYLYCAHVTMFEVGSAICGAAPNMNAMILGRVIAGAGGSGMYVGCLTYIAVSTTPKEKPQYLGMVGLIWAVGTVLGPVVGGAFATSSATWRWAFYINLVIGALLAPVYIFLLPDIDFQRDASFVTKLKQVDWLGILFFDGAMASLIMAIDFGGSLFAWNSGSEITLWVVSGVLFIMFGLTQAYSPFVAVENKLYPTHFFRRPVLLNLQFQLFLASGILFVRRLALQALYPQLLLRILQGAAYYIPLLFQFAQGDSPLGAAVRLLPFIFMVAAFALINGAVMSKTGYYMPWYIFGSVLVLIGSALMCYTYEDQDTVTLETETAKVYAYTVLIGIGIGSVIQAGWSVAECQAPASETSNIIGFMSIGQAIGIVIFFATIGTIYHSRAVAEIRPILPDMSSTDLDKALSGTSGDFFNTLTAAQGASVAAAIIKAMKAAWAMLIAGGACSLIAAPFLPRTKFFDDAKKFI